MLGAVRGLQAAALVVRQLLVLAVPAALAVNGITAAVTVLIVVAVVVELVVIPAMGVMAPQIIIMVPLELEGRPVGVAAQLMSFIR